MAEGPGRDARSEWLRRVLGVTLPEPPAPSGARTGTAPGWAVARQGWTEASEAVDGQIAALQAMLRRSGDDRLHEIAEFGLNAVTGNHKVPLIGALMEMGGGDPATLRKSAPKALGLIEAFRSHLETSEAVEVCDANPFGVPVAIRATLLPALAQMAAALQAAAP